MSGWDWLLVGTVAWASAAVGVWMVFRAWVFLVKRGGQP